MPDHRAFGDGPLRLSPRFSFGIIVALALALALALLLPAAPASAEPVVSCKTPRQATMTFINNLQEDNFHPEAAWSCFDFEGFEGDDAAKEQRVRRLLAVLDARGHYVYYEQIPDDPDHVDAETGIPRYVLFENDLPSIFLYKNGKRWVFSSSSVDSIPRIYDRTFPLGLARIAHRFPAPLHAKFLGIANWKYIAILVLMFLALLMGRLIGLLVTTVFKRIVRRQSAFVFGDEAIRKAGWPISLLVAGVTFKPFVTELALPVRLAQILNVAVYTIIIVSMVIIIFRMIDGLSSYLEKRASKTDTRLDDQLVPLVRKSLKIILSIMGAIFVLQNLQVDVGSLLAGLGIGGLAFALAAKDTIANMFGSLTIFLDRPFQIGDWIKVAGVEGTVEEVGFRSSRVRTFTKALVTVPNSTIAGAVIDNMSQRPMRRLKMVIGLTYDATPDQIQAYCEGVRAILQSTPGIFQDYYEVHFYNFGAHALEILVYAFLDVDSWTKELSYRHAIMLSCMRLAEDVGVSFAFPTQSLHIESMKAGSEPSAPSREELAAIINGYAPGGERSEPTADPITSGYMPNVGSARGGDDA